MGKKTNKLLFLATTTAAIGGALYVFRDKIKESKILENSDENPLKPYLDKGINLVKVGNIIVRNKHNLHAVLVCCHSLFTKTAYG